MTCYFCGVVFNETIRKSLIFCNNFALGTNHCQSTGCCIACLPKRYMYRCTDCKQHELKKEDVFYRRLRRIYLAGSENGEDERRLHVYNLLIKEWQNELPEEERKRRLEPKREQINDDGTMKPLENDTSDSEMKRRKTK